MVETAFVSCVPWESPHIVGRARGILHGGLHLPLDFGILLPMNLRAAGKIVEWDIP